MPSGLGIDVVHIPRVAALDGAALKKIFHDSELADARPERLAGLLAGKEAIIKATRKKAGFLDITISHEPDGAPRAELSTGARVSISISHDRDYAVAVAILEV